MPTYNKFNSFIKDAMEVLNLQTDTLIVALCSSENPPTAGSSVLADLVEIDYTNLSDRTLTIAESSQADGVYSLILTDLVLTASGDVATFRYVVIYDDTPTDPSDPLVCWFDLGVDISLLDGQTLTLEFDPTGIIQVS